MSNTIGVPYDFNQIRRSRFICGKSREKPQFQDLHFFGAASRTTSASDPRARIAHSSAHIAHDPFAAAVAINQPRRAPGLNAKVIAGDCVGHRKQPTNRKTRRQGSDVARVNRPTRRTAAYSSLPGKSINQRRLNRESRPGGARREWLRFRATPHPSRLLHDGRVHHIANRANNRQAVRKTPSAD